MPKVKAIFYDLPDGSYPAQEFIDSLDIKISLDIKMLAKMLRAIAFLQENGSDLREPYSEYLRDGILELRAKVGSNNDFPISCTIESA